jgi:hypothetical protein
MTLRTRNLALFFLCGIAMCFAIVERFDAIYVLPQLIDVPVDRLIRNMEQLVAQDPRAAGLRFNLARVHAMAFALKMTPEQQVKTARGGEANGVWFGPEAELVPFKSVPTTDPAKLAAAKDHLTKAIELYREGVELDPSNLTAKLGYAWCLDQSGDRNKAITAYRHVIAEAWLKEQSFFRLPTPGARGISQVSAPPNWHPLTTEATSYLIPLLDPVKDADEIATLRERVSAFNSLGRAVTPIAIPLRDGLAVSDIVDFAAQVPFDADGSGFRKPWTWITPDAAWLVHAPEGSRPVTSALQMFGSVTFWLFWDNGYQAMQSLDDNADGELEGNELDDLALWRDSNSNGIAEKGEMNSLAAWGIVSLSWKHEVDPSREDYVAFSGNGVTFRNGRSRPTYDILLHTRAEVAKEHP